MFHPWNKIALNPDACLNSLGIFSSEEDIGEIMKSRRNLLDKVIPNIIDDLDAGNLEISTPTELCDLFKTVGINIRFLQKVATMSEKEHIRNLAVTEITWRKIKEIITKGQNYAEEMDTSIFDKISQNMVKQRLWELLSIPSETLDDVDLLKNQPFVNIEFPSLTVKSESWTPESMDLLLKEARKLDEIGLSAKDKYSKDKQQRDFATELFKKASAIWEKIFGDSSLQMADRLLELGMNFFIFSPTFREQASGIRKAREFEME
jgi:hypothetical protein